ncbi:MAG: carbon-nitrogen hydrolase family protein [Lachnospiraceae bacterium]|nr:carbon-nitrogen hydrolase family protein [Lachnospiraceae bacterium]MCM1231988.1 carbon-nitrogen hydrolase family protein [Ruminococcus flavefaciens]
MRVALIQTKQNKLYSFHRPNDYIPAEHALALQKEMVKQCFDLAEGVIGKECDLIVTTEAINFCGLESALNGPCEPYIPLYPDAALFSELSRLAARARSWLVAGVYNKRYDEEGTLYCYNSAFIYDRGGRLQGIYDKIHLAGTENDCLTSGRRTLTIDTDMGKMGVAVCFDMQFQDVCRDCREAGAEFMAVPTWGWEHGYGLDRIRETGMGIAAAMSVPYWMPIEGERCPSELIDGQGRILAKARCETPELLIGEISI